MKKKKDKQQQTLTKKITALLTLMDKMGIKYDYQTYPVSVDGVDLVVTYLALVECKSDKRCSIELHIHNDKFIKDICCFSPAE